MFIAEPTEIMKLSNSNIFNISRNNYEDAKTQLEQPLLNALINGDERAFEKVYKAYFNHLHNYSFLLV